MREHLQVRLKLMRIKFDFITYYLNKSLPYGRLFALEVLERQRTVMVHD